VTDSAGLSSIAGGKLTDANQLDYGTFGTAGGQGTFSLTLSWAEVQSLSPIDFPAGGGSRALTAIFFDNSGQTAHAPFRLELACASSYGACNGNCTDLTRDVDNCGSCGNSCTTWATANHLRNAKCASSVCNGEVNSTMTNLTCSNLCGSLTCVRGTGMYGNPVIAGVDIGCSGTPAAQNGSAPYSYTLCACQ
jgi:hypothetical protein